jgi:pSer/pThr/pTyr-binding forkhead associated (FHA) protein
VLPDKNEILLTEKVRTLGRDDLSNNYAADTLKYISRQHLSIGYENNEFYAVDTNSSNGTKVNGLTIKSNQKYKLADGDQIELGGVLTLVFRVIR